MNFNLVTNIEQCFIAVRDYVPLSLVYYSHIPTAIVAILLAVFIFIKTEKSLASKILLAMTISFSIWSAFDIILWTSYDSRMYMFFWAITIIFEAAVFILSLYFVYAYIDKKDVSFLIKLIWGIFLLPLVLVMGTRYYLTSFSVVDCVPVESPFYNGYVLPLYGAIYLWVVVIIVNRYRKASRDFKKQIIFLFFGCYCFAGFIFGWKNNC